MRPRPSAIVVALSGAVAAAAETFDVPSNPSVSGQPLDGFVSYSIEFSSFPDYAGNLSHPNTYSYNLINNIHAMSGHYPVFRVGGNTQDFALYNASQTTALIGVVDPRKSPDYPTTITIGKSYFESYATWPGVRFSHGFNMGLGGKTPQGRETLVHTAPLACEALRRGNLYAWEYGNEPDLFTTGPYAPRPEGWTETDMAAEWLAGTDVIRSQVKRHCPELKVDLMAPSNAGVSNALTASNMWASGLNRRRDIAIFSTHNYIDGAKVPGVTLQGTLMNHTRTRLSVDAHVAEYKTVFETARPAPPLVFGEANSLYNQGRPGLSNTFGAALWAVDFNMYSATVGFKRVHMHQGTNYRYQAWQPVATDATAIGTKAPYYASMAAAHMTRRVGRSPVSISSIRLSSDAESAYAAHYAPRAGDQSRPRLARLMVINMHGYNTTLDGAGLEPLPDPPQRTVRTYKFRVEGVADGATARVHRLAANGSDAITGITYDGWSYNHDLDEGRAVRLANVTVGEEIPVTRGEVAVRVADSSAVILSFGHPC
ncbi:glycoside hydrolase family 79 protein [Metarhizium album ARSEF 1941]|uniref:Glycoside hydrolase family 79 protein n=1 Tax=Metarhizium album (strain ARSEF 1941) TaxID=1081103 RepID=A0A0B2WXD3_METAS|nr:glycoside hydrolase family 79 protein [Metarhizium album ARSEF 1941]KHN98698.1 glycoside hydrolase family 79 protein [Metarhizium album ARSEF 1941]